MSNRYVQLPNPRSAQPDRDDELEAAFDYSEDEEDDRNISESRPLNTSSTQNTVAPTIRKTSQPQVLSGTYDFENSDYDYPPPGSPPGPSATALPNSHGNSNGEIPSFHTISNPQPSQSWFRRGVVAILPDTVVDRLGLGSQRPQHAVGGGINNDGVFANITAKPTAPVRVRDGDSSYIVHEDARQDVPPSYASAQADAVPPYWETTVHAPFAPSSAGEMIIDALPTGSLFSFLWNMLVSVSFQFIGFLLTYLLHTTHAARLGSRAGLGITLIQYGFALRSKLDDVGDGSGAASWDSMMSDHQSGAGHMRYSGMNTENATSPYATLSEQEVNAMMADATTEWLSFFLMTVGWFILLTSVLGFWRVKRWERGILASQQETNRPSDPLPSDSRFAHPLGRFFALRGVSRTNFLRRGFGLRIHRREQEEEGLADLEEGNAHDASETDLMIPLNPNDPERSQRLVQAIAHERRLQQDLRAAGLL